MTTITCPSCGCSGDEELFGADMEWRRALTHALKLPSDCGPLAGRYVKLFAPLKRNLSSARACKLLKEVSDIVLAEEIVFDRASYRIPSHVWAQSLQIMLDKQDLQRPMPNHNYLKKVAIGQLSKRADIEQSERATNRRDFEPVRIKSPGMKHIGEALPDQETELPDLSFIPACEKDKWLEIAREDLITNHDVKPGGFMSNFLIESRARELYSEDLEKKVRDELRN